MESATAASASAAAADASKRGRSIRRTKPFWESEPQRTRERRKSGDLGSPGKSGDLSSPGSPGVAPVARRPQTAAAKAPSLTRTRWTRGGFAAGACAALVMAVAFRGGDDASLAANRPPPILGPSTLPGGGTIELERPPPRASLPRLRVTPGRVHGEASAAATHAFFDRVLRLRRPFTVLWDPRGVRWPHLTPRHLRIIRAWVDANAEKWDTQVQAHALLLTNPIVRGVARLVIRLFAPPQPLRIVTSEEEALDFARTCCPRPKSWVKASYADRDERFKVFGSAWGLG